MRLLVWLSLCVVMLVAVAGCGRDSSTVNGNDLVARARRSWMGDWHAVWQVEWQGAPLRGPLLAEMWHSADGRMRIETLEASSPAMSGLTLLDDGHKRWLYGMRLDRRETGTPESARIPLANDALDAVDWLFLQMDNAAIDVSGWDALESGLATRVDVVLPTGDRATLWVQDETGLPSRVELRSAAWGQASFVTRNISVPDRLHPDLFSPLQED